MVTTIGVDPHKATHTAVAIDESERVLGEVTVRANRSQLKTLLDWADRVDGDGRTRVRQRRNQPTTRALSGFLSQFENGRMTLLFSVGGVL